MIQASEIINQLYDEALANKYTLNWVSEKNQDRQVLIFVSPELSSVRDYVITHSVRSMYYVVYM